MIHIIEKNDNFRFDHIKTHISYHQLSYNSSPKTVWYYNRIFKWQYNLRNYIVFFCSIFIDEFESTSMNANQFIRKNMVKRLKSRQQFTFLWNEFWVSQLIQCQNTLNCVQNSPLHIHRSLSRKCCHLLKHCELWYR